MGCAHSSSSRSVTVVNGAVSVATDAGDTTSSRRRQSSHFDDKYFTRREKRLIRVTWDLVKHDELSIGIRIFRRLFEVKPEAKQLFPFRQLQGDALLSDPLFRSHAMRFMQAIGSTVRHLDALDVSCGPTFEQLGRRHVMLVDNFLTSGYLSAFVESVATVFEQVLPVDNTVDCDAKEVYDAWRNVFTFVVNHMREGYKLAQDTAGPSTAPRTVNNTAESSLTLEDVTE